MDLITIETTAGMFTVELYRLHAPKTCYNFTELVKIGATNEAIFRHRNYALIVLLNLQDTTTIPYSTALLETL
jgi:cyclophilin family peptidyl-prolyl cis-trans isomerase